MTRPRHPKPDANQAQINAQLDDIGGFVICNVSSLPVAKAGCDEYVYGWNVVTRRVELHGFEIKMPGEGLTDREREFFARVHSLGSDGGVLHVARCVEDMLRPFGWNDE